MGKKTILWINYLKAISIIGVYIVHCQLAYGYWNSSLNNFIHPFYVNAFFFVSGYLLFRKQLSESQIKQERKVWFAGDGKIFLKNILYRLMIPTLLFSIIEFLPSFMFRGREFDVSMFLYKTLGGCTYWFTAALAVAEILTFIMLLTRRKSIWFYFIVGLVLYIMGAFIVSRDYSLFEAWPSLPWQYKHGLYAMIFIVSGGAYWCVENMINKYMNKIILAFMIGIYVVSLLTNPTFFRVLISTLDLNIPGVLLGILATVILIELCKLLPGIKLLNYIGQNTIGFYFMSGALPIVISSLVNKFSLEQSIIGVIVVFSLSMLIALGAVYFINRCLPWLFDLRVLWKKDKL